MIPTLALLWIPSAAASDGAVVLSPERWWEIAPPGAEQPEQPPGLIGVTRRDVRLGATADGELTVRATWRVEVRGRSPVLLRLSRSRIHVRSATLDGRPTAIGSTSEGIEWAGTPDGPFTLTVEGVLFAGGHPEQALLDLLPAASGTVAMPADWRLDGGEPLGPGLVAGAPAMLTVHPAAPRPDRGRVVLGEVGLGLTFGEADLVQEARLRWRVASGSLDRVAFTVQGMGPDLVVSGPQVGRWTREGDRIEVELASEERVSVDLTVSGSSRLPQTTEATVSVPAITLEDVFRTTTAVELARDGTLDLVPHLGDLQPTAVSALPSWGSDLVRGTPTAAYVGTTTGGTVDLLRFTPVESPATLVDVAAVEAAVSEDGHVLMRAHYAVRNDRGAALRITPPPGLHPVAVRVAGDAVDVSSDGRTWLIPLRKSVESVEGLLGFGVEIAFLGTDAAWSARDRRSFPLPVVDADVAVTRVTLHLPPGWTSRSRVGRDEVVGAFTEGGGITYGFAIGDTRAAQADTLYQQAIDAWMDNEFDAAQERLDELKALGGENADVSGLQANLDVVAGNDRGAVDDAASRRILDQARARSEDDLRQQAETVRAAKEAEERGDYESANAEYGKAMELSDKLGRLANTEDVSQEKLKEEVAEKVSKNVVRQERQSVVTGGALGGSAVEGPADTPTSAPSEAEPERPVTTAGTLRISVVDDDGLPIPGVDVELQSVALPGGIRHVVTDADGTLAASDLPPGTYRLSVQRPPFQGVAIEGLAVVGGRITVQQVTLHYALAEEIVVEAKASAVPRVTRAAPAAPKKKADVSAGEALAAPSSGDAPPEAPSPDVGLSPSAPLVVTAAHGSLVVPDLGEPVLYQHLLLPAGADLSVRVDARRSRRKS